MNQQRIDAIVVQKIATLEEWNAITRIPEKGEMMFIQNSAAQPVNFKIGDGSRLFSSLPNFIAYDQAAYVSYQNNILPSPENGVGYSILVPGSYNSGAIIIPGGSLGYAQYIGDQWVVDNMELPDVGVYTEESLLDFVISDDQNNAIAEFNEGHLTLENFDTRNAALLSDIEIEARDEESVDLSFSDDQDRDVVQFSDGHIKTKKFDSRNIKTTSSKTVKLLFWGNSFSRDCGMYMPFLLEEMGVDNVTIGIIYASGATLQYNWINRGNSVYSLDYYSTEIGSWTTSSGHTARYGIELEDWDMIFLQQQSVASRDYSTYQPHANNLLNYIAEVALNSCSIRFHMIPASPFTGAWGAPGVTSDQFFQDQLVCYERLKNESGIEGFIYAGTAIQNARQTSLSSVGNNLTSPDQVHLNEGLPCLIAAYGNVMGLKDILGLTKSVYGSKIRPTDAWIIEKNIIEPHGVSIGLTESNILLAQKCAIMAYKFPFAISQIDF